MFSLAKAGAVGRRRRDHAHTRSTEVPIHGPPNERPYHVKFVRRTGANTNLSRYASSHGRTGDHFLPHAAACADGSARASGRAERRGRLRRARSSRCTNRNIDRARSVNQKTMWTNLEVSRRPGDRCCGARVTRPAKPWIPAGHSARGLRPRYLLSEPRRSGTPLSCPQHEGGRRVPDAPPRQLLSPPVDV